ncbi:hypothetical protein N7516_007035 [Penicillium verrucosum]|uniref:uncharacterized protein n=1 Tax=Penicillium verrucosum TaxID=60171 RepID=UPI0025457CF7|nr:uncharacterized protein N7516_007035 [Penicillium verrucosum]KAJ5932546.1 hypothetical protein N7516_007035 [Penicillium verrucosum]
MICSRKLPISLKVGDSLEPNTKSNINTQTQTYITTNSETPNLPVKIQDIPPDLSEAICLRVRLHGNPGRGRILRDELITRRLIGLLFGFPLQHSSCHNSNHDEKNDAEDKHHPAVPVRPVALVARSFDNLMER